MRSGRWFHRVLGRAVLLLFLIGTVLVPAPRLVEAGHLFYISSLRIDQGERFASTTARYWEQNQSVYRRGDRLTATVEFAPGAGAIGNGESPVPDVLIITVHGPADYSWPYDAMQCIRAVALIYNCQSTNGRIQFLSATPTTIDVRVSFGQPEVNATAVRVGKYVVRAYASWSVEPGDRQDLVLQNGELPQEYEELPASYVEERAHRALTAGDSDADSREPLYVIFNPFENSGDSHVSGLGNDAAAHFAYNRIGWNYFKTSGYIPVGNPGDGEPVYIHYRPTQGANPAMNRFIGGAVPWVLNPDHPQVFTRAIAAVDKLGTASAQGASGALVLEAGQCIQGNWGANANRDQIALRDVSAILGMARPDGQCFSFAGVLSGLHRAVGIPDRMTTNVNSLQTPKGGAGGSLKPWNFHAWNEVWLQEITNDWSAADATVGQQAVSRPDFQSVLGYLGTWQKRFTGDPGPTTWRSRVYTRDATTRSRIDVTTAYVDPLPDPPTPTDAITLIPLQNPVPYGQPLVFETEALNVATSDRTVKIAVSLRLIAVPGNPRVEQEVLLHAAPLVMTIPAGMTASGKVTLEPEDLPWAGLYVAEAEAVWSDGSTDTALAGSIEVESGLRVEILAPPLAQAGVPTVVPVRVTNLAAVPATNIAVQLQVPADVSVRLGSASFTIPRLEPGQSVEERLLVERRAPSPVLLIAAASSAETGYAVGETLLEFAQALRFIRLKPDQTSREIDGTVDTMDTVPIIQESRTLLPIRFVAEPLGAQVTFDDRQRQVTVILDDTRIDLFIGKPEAIVNGERVLIDPDNPLVVPIIKDDRTFLPLRFIAERLGALVEWDPNARTVTVTGKRP